MSKFKAIIFDLDGTLLDTCNDIMDSLNYACNKNGLGNTTLDKVKYAMGSGKLVLIERTLKTHPDNPIITDELYNNMLRDYLYVYNLWKNNKTKPFEGVVKTLNILKRRGVILTVLTNKPQEDAKGCLMKHFAKDTFNIIQGQIEGCPPKPSKQMTDLVIDKLVNDYHINKDEIMYVGDSEVDVEVYKNAGIFGVGVCYGYRSKKELEACGCNVTINSMREILRFFDEPNDGILLVNKPYGLTSQDCVTQIRKHYHIDKVGHAGTLDPLATGLLVVLLGDATKLSNYLLEDNKEYICEITIGEETNTWDKEGNICLTKPVEKELDIDNLLENLKGKLMLTPPIHSAIKKDGKKLYELARNGEEVIIDARESIIYDISRISEIEYKDNLCIFKFKTKVSKGTYIRSLCHYIGELLGYPAYMTGLVRTMSGGLKLEDSNTLDDILNDKASIINIVDALDKDKVFVIKDSLLPYIDNGRPVYLPVDKDMLYIIYKNSLLAIYEHHDDGKYYAKRVWKRMQELS